MIVDLCCYGSVCLFTTDDKALRTGLQREGRKDGVQGANIGQEFSDDFGGNISFVWFMKLCLAGKREADGCCSMVGLGNPST